jgi:hypothetical protein
MKTWCMLLVGIFLLVSCLGVGLATPPTRTNLGTASGLIYHDGLRDITIWCQYPDLVNWAKLASQIDVIYPFDAGAADDFQSATDYAATHIQWWGGQWNYTGYGATPPPCGPDYFVITFYHFGSTCYPPDPMPVAPNYWPNNYYYQEIVTSWNEIVLDAAYNLVEYDADIGPVLMDAGGVYWLEIQAVMDFSSCGQWGWLKSTETWNCPTARGFPLLGSPYWYSDTTYPAVAFCLYSDQSVAVDGRTWGNVKALYR